MHVTELHTYLCSNDFEIFRSVAQKSCLPRTFNVLYTFGGKPKPLHGGKSFDCLNFKIDYGRKPKPLFGGKSFDWLNFKIAFGGKACFLTKICFAETDFYDVIGF